MRVLPVAHRLVLHVLRGVDPRQAAFPFFRPTAQVVRDQAVVAGRVGIGAGGQAEPRVPLHLAPGGDQDGLAGVPRNDGRR